MAAGDGRNIPAALDRAVRVEAGHRCAIPTCRQTSGLEVHHIKDWATERCHEFDNLILLCAVCHRRASPGGDIDRKAVLAYKANLGLLTSRYGDLERRVLEHFVKDPAAGEILLDKSHALLLAYLVQDGILAYAGTGPMTIWYDPDDGQHPQPLDGLDNPHVIGPLRWSLTDAGRDLVEQLRAAHEIE